LTKRIVVFHLRKLLLSAERERLQKIVGAPDLFTRYIPHDSFIAAVDSTQAARLSSLPEVDWVCVGNFLFHLPFNI
jgi:hypothetical protein